MDLKLGPGSSLLLLAGENCSGKSTLLTMAASIVILAHVGARVPAKSCQCPLLDRVMARIGTDDDPELKSSTFYLEMSEVRYFFRHTSLLLA